MVGWMKDGIPGPWSPGAGDFLLRGRGNRQALAIRTDATLKGLMSKHGRFLAGFAVVVFVASFAAKTLLLGPAPGDAEDGAASKAVPQRIISLAPSATEVLFALGLGDRVCGVTRYCSYPPEAKEKDQVGGFFDPNYEAIVALEPDIVVLFPTHGEIKDRLHDLGIETLLVDHRTLDSILESIRITGDACGVSQRADAILKDLRARIDRVRAKTEGLERPRVLVSAGRSLGSGRLEEVYAAGKNMWYDQLITWAGGVNAFEDETVQFPSLSGEGLLWMDPDVIIEMAPNLDDGTVTREGIIEEWRTLSDLKAVRDKRVYVLGGDHVTIPGPRFVLVLEDMVRAIHPEVDLNGS